MIFLSRGSLVCSVPWELFLTKKIQDQKNMPQIILKERTAHLASYTFFTRDVDQYKNTSLWQLYQPSRTPFSQNTYHYLLSRSEYCKVFKSSFFIETSRSSRLKMFFKQVFLKVSQTLQESTCVGKHLSLFLKNLLAEGLQLY